MIHRYLRSRRLDRRVLDSWSAHCAGNFRRLDRFATTLVRYAIVQGRQVLANAHEPKSLRTLARVLYRQQMYPSDLRDAIGLYRELAATASDMLDPVDIGYFVDACTNLGNYDEARGWLDRHAAGLGGIDACTYLLANLLNPHTTDASSDAGWLEQLNAPFVAQGLEPVELRERTGAAFLRLACTASAPVTDGPLVSVLMPVYGADAATDLAIESVLGQSWRNLELIVVDDASDRASRERLLQWEGRDARLRIVYNEDNRGAYVARNTAYAMASGEFVTVSDKDDWHHPRKIELHARDLLSRPDRLANMSCWCRVDRQLRILVRYAPLQMAHPSLPSLFFRRQPVLDKLGYWDQVRKGADGEYKARLERLAGAPIKPFVAAPLALSLMGRENLTSGDFGLGYEHPDRSVYKHTYGHWHRSVPAETPLRLGREPDSRPFPIPASFAPVQRATPGFDLVLAFDLSAADAVSECMRTEISEALTQGLQTAVLHLPNPFRLVPRHRAPVDWLSDLVLAGRITRVSLADSLALELLVLGTPHLLQFAPATGDELAARQVTVRADRPPSDAANGAYSPRAVAANVRRMFGARAQWLPTSEAIRAELRRVLPRRDVLSGTWQGVVPLVDAPRR